MTTSTHLQTQPPLHRPALPAADPGTNDGVAVRPGRGYWGTLAGIGVIGGVLSGLFAIGGGILMVPLLVWRAGAFVASGAIAGAVVGSRLLRRMPLAWLRWMFIVFILAVAVRLLFSAPERGHLVELSVTVALGYVGLGLVMGVASGLFGIGGGIIAVPLLVSLFSVGDLVAKGTALLVSIPTSAVGTVSNRRTGLVDVRAGLVVGAAAAAASVPAVYLALAIPAALSGILFAVLLLAVAAQLTAKALHARR